MTNPLSATETATNAKPTSKILEGLNALKEIRVQSLTFQPSPGWQEPWDNLQRQLTLLMSQMDERELKLPEDDIPRLRSLWEEILTNKDYNRVSPRDMRKLCLIPEIQRQPAFDVLLRHRQADLRNGAVLALGLFVHQDWQRLPHERRSFLCELIQNRLSKLRGGIRLSKWKQAKVQTFHPQVTLTIAKLVISDKAIKPDDACQQLGIDPNASLCTEVREQSLKLWLNSLKHLPQPSADEFRVDLNRLLNSNDTESIDQLIIMADEIPDYRDALTSWCLNTFKDPRLHGSTSWSKLPIRCKEIMLKWLSKENLQFFFEMVISSEAYDIHRRRSFWEPYVEKVQYSQVFMNDEDWIENRDYLRKMEQDGKTLPGKTKSGQNQSSIFWMELGPFIVIEFKETGNATFIYSRDDLTPRLMNIRENLFNTRVKYYSSDFKINPLSELTQYSYHSINPPFKSRHSDVPGQRGCKRDCLRERTSKTFLLWSLAV